MTSPTDLIRREDVEALIRARQSITQDPMIYAGLSVALQELAALPADPVAEAAGFDFRSFASEFHQWALATFGPGRRTRAISEHIRRELAEIAAEPDSVEEWCDVMMLALNGAMRTGATAEEVAATLAAKLAKNKARTWPDWRTADPNEPIEHDRRIEPESASAIMARRDKEQAQREWEEGRGRIGLDCSKCHGRLEVWINGRTERCTCREARSL